VQDSPSSSRRVAWRSRSTQRSLALVVVVLAAALHGCATVRPEEREFLAEPAMSFNSGGMTDAHEDHVINNREASFGGGSAKGGGCGCN